METDVMTADVAAFVAGLYLWAAVTVWGVLVVGGKAAGVITRKTHWAASAACALFWVTLIPGLVIYSVMTRKPS